MGLELQIELLAQLFLAAILSMVIGLQRERSGKPAGLRTHMLAGIASCLFTMIGMYAVPSGDPSRLAAGVATGIGFLGGGTVFRDKNQVRALTTAASIWATASIGVAVAAGAWFLAIGATLIVWFTLSVLHNWEQYFLPNTGNDSNQS